MEAVQYLGESLWPGKLGHILLLLSFVSSILAFVAFAKATNGEVKQKLTWSGMGRAAFSVHVLTVILAIGLIFYIMLAQLYEYEYAWAHVSEELPLQYIFSAFWEGQQGSFLLWMFWHGILGMILVWRADRWHAPVLSVLSAVQVFLLSMVLGIYFTADFQLGVSPFGLLRDAENMADLPIFAQANYLEQIEGKGLNPLLQNYWMVIHPPTLFLGFAAVTIPFCYAVAGLWKKEYKAWLPAVLPWGLFAAAILGTGIVMGGAWAYEALSFGGYWAWDPVENASLVPWLILIGAVHMNLVAKATGHSIKGTYIFYLLSFLFILYSTFLTRSGILGDSSVHAFTDMGLEWQLIAFMATFLVAGLWQYVRHRKQILSPPKEEELTSREFWLFIGSLILLFSGGIIIFSTSLPVFNQLIDVWGGIVGKDLSDWHRATPEDVMSHYNKFQIWIALLIGLLSGTSLFLRYKESRWADRRNKILRQLGIALIISLPLTYVVNMWIQATSFPYHALLFGAVFAIVINFSYLATVLRWKTRAASSTIAHIGFGVMILGILASGLKKNYISSNPFAMQGLFEAGDDRVNKNVYLIKGKPMFMNDYLVTYLSDTLVGNNRSYRVEFAKMKEGADEVEDQFEVEPYITYNTEMTEMVNPNPDTKRYLHRDIFSHITSVPLEVQSTELAKQFEDSLKYQQIALMPGQQMTLNGQQIGLAAINMQPTHKEYAPEDNDLAFGLELQVWDSVDAPVVLKPMLVVRDGYYIFSYHDQSNEHHLRIKLDQESLDAVFPQESLLEYQPFSGKQGDIFEVADKVIRIAGFDREPESPSYVKQEGDIAVAARLEVMTKSGQPLGVVKPIFLIRDNHTYLIKDYQPTVGLSAKFTAIHPDTESFDLLLADATGAQRPIPMLVAQDVPRTDFLVLETIEFPGINLFWLGCVMMMGGLAMGMVQRAKHTS
ncbi:MAG: cytochrome c biogenesis protein CcsA [Saprospiraceae bacterium]|nr:cytochrome c biogenesis protein CcsA [Saprospiraceae bacterium]